MNGSTKDEGCQGVGDDYPQGGDDQGNPDSMKEESANLFGQILPGATCNECLQPVVQSIADHGKDQVVYTGDSRTGQLQFTEAAKKDVVGNKVDLWDKNRQGDRHG